MTSTLGPVPSPAARAFADGMFEAVSRTRRRAEKEAERSIHYWMAVAVVNLVAGTVVGYLGGFLAAEGRLP
ncbi:MAG: hypothetical protein KGI98_14495 [Euryarchaeota archaeon]|nr:hypothetical protein [Euryarchaeota archaeon]MDE1881154.1 hypothetical protein [Euryarchaeota archaeon]